ncbi:hypothetical protein LTR17_026777 [Elasticomyces elasticus]|nr:hypothetical protein LTR17_026777 [Elasticomyces elasticus]
MTKSDAAAPPTPTDAPDSRVEATDFAQNSSVRQSPPPINNLRIPTGMVLSPPESPEILDGDDESSGHRGREMEKTWDQLKEAVRAIDQRRTGSPDKGRVHIQETASEPVSQVLSPTGLSAEARKIAHSRSSTETAIIIPKATTFDSPVQQSDDSDEDQDQGPFSKPSLVRKKSGELVKPALRASSRRRYSSMPGTPTYSKSVHFNEEVNQTRHFLQVDKPMAVSAGTSPVETYDSESEFPFDNDSKTEREIQLANFPEDTFERKTLPVRVERIFLSADKQTLIGTVVVQNLSFHKLVIARFTLDYWKTTSEVVAEYNNDPRSPPKDGCDRFSFSIKLSDSANIDTKTLLLCVRYAVNGQDYWDNNNGLNYQVDFTTKSAIKAQRPTISVSGLGARPLNAIPRSRHSPTTSRGRQESVDDDFTRMSSGSTYHFGPTDKLLGDSSNNPIKLKTRTKRGSVFPTSATTTTNGLGGRYDFGASLSAALSTAQDKLGRQSGLMSNGRKPGTGGSYFGPVDRTAAPTKTDERPDALTTDRPAMGSDQYKDLVQKFCYFTPGALKPAAAGTTPQSKSDSDQREKTDGAADSPDATTPSQSPASSRSPGNGSPPSQNFDGSNEGTISTNSSYNPQTASGTPPTGQSHSERAPSPISFGYPYHSSTRDGYFTESPALTAIRG